MGYRGWGGGEQFNITEIWIKEMPKTKSSQNGLRMYPEISNPVMHYSCNIVGNAK